MVTQTLDIEPITYSKHFFLVEKKSVNTIFRLFLVLCFQLPTTHTPD